MGGELSGFGDGQRRDADPDPGRPLTLLTVTESPASNTTRRSAPSVFDTDLIAAHLERPELPGPVGDRLARAASGICYADCRSGAVAQSGSAPRSHRGGQGFKSPQLHMSFPRSAGQRD